MPTKAPQDHLDKLSAEAKAKLDPATSEVVEIEWEGVKLNVLPVMKWKTAALNALRQGDIEEWASRSLTNDTYRLWQKVDPDMGQAEAFFVKWTEATGESRPN